MTHHDLESVTGIRLLKLALMKTLKNYSKDLSKRIIEGDELYVTLRTWWGPCADFQLFFFILANSVGNINTTRSLQKSRKQYASVR